MLEDTKADGAIIMGVSIFMVMKRTPQNGERKTDEEN
jgi:hypothetical protein